MRTYVEAACRHSCLGRFRNKECDSSKAQSDVAERFEALTVLILMLSCSFFFQEAENLVSQKMHPQTIVSGWRKSVDVARQSLENFAKNHG